MRQIARAAFLHAPAHGFGNDAAGDGRGKKGDNPREPANEADDINEYQRGNKRQRQGNDYGNDVICPRAGVKFVFLFANALRAGVAYRRAYGAFAANVASAFIAAQAGFHGGVTVAESFCLFLVIGHWSLVPCHWFFATACHSPFAIRHSLRIGPAQAAH